MYVQFNKIDIKAVIVCRNDKSRASVLSFKGAIPEVFELE